MFRYRAEQVGEKGLPRPARTGTRAVSARAPRSTPGIFKPVISPDREEAGTITGSWVSVLTKRVATTTTSSDLAVAGTGRAPWPQSPAPRESVGESP